MTYKVALTFEDGVTRFVEVDEGEPVADASLRAGINVPVDCMDGVCGSCKSLCESGTYELGEYIVDYAMTEEEEEQRYVLTCQLFPKSDLVVSVPVSSDLADTAPVEHSATVTSLERLSPTTTHMTARLDERAALSFLPGQYVNITVPGTDQARSYSFSSGPQSGEISFLLRNLPGGVMSTYLAEQAVVGDALSLVGPFGSFYLREVTRPQLFLAGGTGLAPFMSMLAHLVDVGLEHPVHLVYGVTNDEDLVQVQALEQYAAKLEHFTFVTCVADEASQHPRTGYVTGFIEPGHLNDGEVDVALCGPPAMVEAVRAWLAKEGVHPRNFYFEKFSDAGLVSETGAVHG